MPRNRLIAVAIGGVAGAALRWVLLESIGPTSFPTATLIANLVACLALGALIARGRRDAIGVGLATGFCGGLSTMSTLAVELAEFGRDGDLGLFVLYLAASLLGGAVALNLGRRLA